MLNNAEYIKIRISYGPTVLLSAHCCGVLGTVEFSTSNLCQSSTVLAISRFTIVLVGHIKLCVPISNI